MGRRLRAAGRTKGNERGIADGKKSKGEGEKGGSKNIHEKKSLFGTKKGPGDSRRNELLMAEGRCDPRGGVDNKRKGD